MGGGEGINTVPVNYRDNWTFGGENLSSRFEYFSLSQTYNQDISMQGIFFMTIQSSETTKFLFRRPKPAFEVARWITNCFHKIQIAFYNWIIPPKVINWYHPQSLWDTVQKYNKNSGRPTRRRVLLTQSRYSIHQTILLTCSVYFFPVVLLHFVRQPNLLSWQPIREDLRW